jgi:hypothetical protein
MAIGTVGSRFPPVTFSLRSTARKRRRPRSFTSCITVASVAGMVSGAPGADVELGAVSRTGDGVPAQLALAQRAAVVGADVVQAVEPAADVEQNDDRVLDLVDCFPGSGRSVVLAILTKSVMVCSLVLPDPRAMARPSALRTLSIGIRSKICWKKPLTIIRIASRRVNRGTWRRRSVPRPPCRWSNRACNARRRLRSPARDRVGSGAVAQQQVVVPLVAVGRMAPGSTLIMPRQTVRERSCKAALYRKSLRQCGASWCCSVWYDRCCLPSVNITPFTWQLAPSSISRHAG